VSDEVDQPPNDLLVGAGLIVNVSALR